MQTTSIDASSQEESCSHYWLIESPNGPTSTGECQNCGEVREFKNSIQITSWNRTVATTGPTESAVRQCFDQRWTFLAPSAPIQSGRFVLWLRSVGRTDLRGTPWSPPFNHMIAKLLDMGGGGPSRGENDRGPVAELHARIRSKGPITFAEFQAVALYWPNGGYYAARSPVGTKGDFYTAPHLHPAFGAMVAQQMVEMWRLMGAPGPWQVVEMGAGSGRLATDVVESLGAAIPDRASALRYTAIDVAGPPASLPAQVEWVRADGLPIRHLQGCVLANELLDALPVHRVTVQEGRLRELFVTVDGQGNFVEAVGDPSTPALEARLGALASACRKGTGPR